MVRCLTSARFTMNAEVLRWEGVTVGDSDDVTNGTWETYQDPITGEVLNNWVPGTPAAGNIPATNSRTIDCIARGMSNGGIGLSRSNERFGDEYKNIEQVRLWVPANEVILKNDRITNIRDSAGGNVLWREEDGSPMIFNVNGITPLFDPFNRNNQNFILLERAE